MNRDEFFEFQFKTIINFYINLRGYRTIYSNIEKIVENKTFWNNTCNSCLELLFIEWCKIFGSKANDTHWQKYCTEKDISEFKEIILNKTNLSLKGWMLYHKSMTDFRNEYVAHTSKVFDDAVPSLDNALIVLRTYENWIKKKLLDDGILYEDDLYDYVNIYEEDLKNALKKK